MRKLFYISILFVCSCSPFLLNTQGYEYLEMDLETAWRKTASFKYIPEEIQYTKSPIEFERDGGGDCADFCAYLVYLLGKNSSMVILKDHGIVLYNGKYIEPQIYGYSYDSTELDINSIFTYKEVMEVFTIYGTKKL